MLTTFHGFLFFFFFFGLIHAPGLHLHYDPKEYLWDMHESGPARGELEARVYRRRLGEAPEPPGLAMTLPCPSETLGGRALRQPYPLPQQGGRKLGASGLIGDPNYPRAVWRGCKQ